jgi:hypothetical protein
MYRYSAERKGGGWQSSDERHRIIFIVFKAYLVEPEDTFSEF